MTELKTLTPIRSKEIESILKGVNHLTDTVKVTLGAKGKNVVFRDLVYKKTTISKDGVTVAKHVFSHNDLEQMAIEITREASEQTVKTAGDGTTTTLVLAQYLINEGMKILEQGVSYYQLANELEKTKVKIIELIEKGSITIEEDFNKLLDVASISANNKEIGEYLFKVMKEIGLYGHIEVKESKATKTKVQQVKGIKYHKGYYAPQFLNNFEKMEWRVEDVYIVMLDDTLRTMNDLMPYLQKINGKEGQIVNNHPILFVVNGVEPTLLNTLITNKKMNPNAFNIMITEHDGFGDRRTEIMNDIAAMTSAVIGDCEKVGGVIGRAREVIVDEDFTSIVGGYANQELVDELVGIVESRLEDPEMSAKEAIYYKRRLATLAGGVAVIHVGAPTEVEMKEKKDRIDDAVEAIRAAIDRGVSIGGGYRFLNTAETLYKDEDESMGQYLLARALEEPFYQLCKNGGIPKEKAQSIAQSIKNAEVGYDVITDKVYEIKDYNVYDPSGVLIDALSNAVSVAKNILSIEKAIVH